MALRCIGCDDEIVPSFLGNEPAECGCCGLVLCPDCSESGKHEEQCFLDDDADHEAQLEKAAEDEWFKTRTFSPFGEGGEE